MSYNYYCLVVNFSANMQFNPNKPDDQYTQKLKLTVSFSCHSLSPYPICVSVCVSLSSIHPETLYLNALHTLQYIVHPHLIAKSFCFEQFFQVSHRSGWYEFHFLIYCSLSCALWSSPLTLPLNLIVCFTAISFTMCLSVCRPVCLFNMRKISVSRYVGWWNRWNSECTLTVLPAILQSTV